MVGVEFAEALAAHRLASRMVLLKKPAEHFAFRWFQRDGLLKKAISKLADVSTRMPGKQGGQLVARFKDSHGFGPAARALDYRLDGDPTLLFVFFENAPLGRITPEGSHAFRAKLAGLDQNGQPFGGRRIDSQYSLRAQLLFPIISQNDLPAVFRPRSNRQGRPHHLAYGVMIVPGDPAVQRNEGIGKERGIGEYGRDGFDRQLFLAGRKPVKGG